jgi:hypothetical protein
MEMGQSDTIKRYGRFKQAYPKVLMSFSSTGFYCWHSISTLNHQFASDEGIYQPCTTAKITPMLYATETHEEQPHSIPFVPLLTTS